MSIKFQSLLYSKSLQDYIIVKPRYTHSIFVAYVPCSVGATTRKAASAELLKANGADEVFIDSGSIAADVEKAGKFDKAYRSYTWTVNLGSSEIMKACL